MLIEQRNKNNHLNEFDPEIRAPQNGNFFFYYTNMLPKWIHTNANYYVLKLAE